MTISLSELDRAYSGEHLTDDITFMEAMNNNYPAISRALKAAKAITVERDADGVQAIKDMNAAFAELDAAMEDIES